ncbi:MAG TPA: MBL fold metallo-hydrolase [Vicinamibacterales bacterium]|nr:MBL fold metallo-hydrolase [Vicinamibacterales bacterium]
MTRQYRVASTALLFLAVSITASAQRGGGAPAAPPLVRENATEKITEHVYVIPDNNVGMVPNIGIIVGTRGTFVVDTGLGNRNGQTVTREIQKVSKTPELYLATTHFHPEHDLGANGFPTHTKMIRSQDQQKEIAEQGLATADRFRGFSPANAELLQGAEFRKADVSFDREHTVELGGVRVRVLAMGYNHTRGDTAFFVEPDGVLFSGDVVMTALPNVGNSTVRQWLASMSVFEKLQPKRIVPSHGPMGDAGLVASYKTLLTTVSARAGELKKQGKTLEEATAAITAELQAKYPNGGARLTGTIRAAYNEVP